MWRVYGILKILRLKGHVIQRMRNPKIAVVRYVSLHVHCTATRPTYDIESISETTTPINMKSQDNIWTTKMCPAMQYCDVADAAILKIAKLPYLSEKSSDFDKIWYTNRY